MSRPRNTQPKFSLYKNGGYFYVQWTHEGRTKRVSTRTADEAAAKRFLSDFEAGFNAPPPKDQITIEQACNAYLATKKDLIADGYRQRNYDALQGSLAPIQSELGHLFIATLTRQHSRDYIAKRKLRNLSNATIKRELDILVAALNHIRKDGWITHVPHVDKPTPPPARDKTCTPEQLKDFFRAIKSQHVKVFAMLAMHTLARKTAILELTWSRVDLENRLIQYLPEGRNQTNKRRVQVPINDSLYRMLLEAKKLARTDHVVEYLGKPVIDIKKAFSGSACDAGMKWLTPHVLRHTGATLMARAGVDMLQIAGIMGDRLQTVEKHYLKQHPSYLRNAAEALDNIYTF